MKTISVLIEVYNEEKNIADCIQSAKLLINTIVMVDMESTDRTIEIAKKFSIQLCSFPYSHYVEPAREFGIKQIKTDWVMILDADERMTKELATEINEAIQTNIYSYYKVPRKNIFSGKWLRHGGWWPDFQTRLINTRAFKTWPANIHSTPQIKGRAGYLKKPFLHMFHGNLTTMVKKTIIFEDIESDLLFNADRQVSVFVFFRKFLGELGRRLVIRKGFLDGEIGIIESVYQAFSKTITYLFLYEKKRRTL